MTPAASDPPSAHVGAAATRPLLTVHAENPRSSLALKDEKSAEMSIEQPTRLELLINLKTAKAERYKDLLF